MWQIHSLFTGEGTSRDNPGCDRIFFVGSCHLEDQLSVIYHDPLSNSYIGRKLFIAQESLFTVTCTGGAHK